MQGIIYLITNKITGEMYVGQTIRTLKQRCQQHFSHSKNIRLLRAIKKYGKDQFYTDQIDYATSFIELNIKEIYWINKLNTLSPNGYNLREGGLNGSPSEESKLKMSLSHIGHKTRLGYKHSEETRKQYSITRKGKKQSEETKRKRAESHLGRKNTDETKLKMSLASKNKPKSETHKLNMSLSNKGRKPSPESIQKGVISIRKLGPRYKKKYKGITNSYRKLNPYRATIVVKGKTISIGNFKTEYEAAIAYDQAILKYCPNEDRYLNFPNITIPIK